MAISLVKAGYVDRSYTKVGWVKMLEKIWPGVVYSGLSPFQVGEVSPPRIQHQSDVLVDHIYSGICGTDIALLHAHVDPRVAPTALSRYNRIYLGHEILARVSKKGDDVQGFDIGDRVTVTQGQSCSIVGKPECTSCLMGQPYLCKNTSEPSKRHLDTGGGWAAHWKYDYRQLTKIPDDISDHHAVLTEPLGIAIHAVLRKAPVKSDKVLVYGAGFIGIATLLSCKFISPETEVFVICRYQFQADMVRKNGGIPIRTEAPKEISDILGAHYFKGLLGNEMLLGGFDIIYDCVGNQKTVGNSIRWVRARGTVVLVGVHLYLSKIDLSPIWYQEVKLLGSYGRGKEEINGEVTTTDQIAFDMYRSGLINPEELITHKFRLSEYKKAVKVLQNKSDHHAIKAVFDFNT